MAGLPAREVGGRGAGVPFLEYEAENGRTNGVAVGPDRTFTTLAAEASGRRAVRLGKPGQFVEFTLRRAADALTVRYAIPDSADGAGQDASLGVYVGAQRIASLPLTSRYGWFYGRYPFSNRPADGLAHHFYDHARLKLGRRLAAGTTVRIMVGPQDRAAWYIVDLVDFEQTPPPRRPPPRALSVLDFGADPTAQANSLTAFQQAVAAGQRGRRPVWIPPGTFRLDGHLQVDEVVLTGAGPWYSVLTGQGVGIYGHMAGGQSRAVVLKGFAIQGEVRERDDHAQLNGVGGALGDGSRIEDLFIQHTKVGVWLDGPLDGLVIRRLRILDTTADGLNLRRGASHVLVEDCFVRNVGDDGLALWSQRLADHHVVLHRNTVIAPILANGVALYGGHDLEVRGNLVADTLTEGGGLHLGNRFSAVPASGPITFADNLVVRAGSFDPHWRGGVGALWFYALDAAIDAEIRVARTELRDSSFEAIQFIGKPIRRTDFDTVRIHRPGTYAFQLQAGGEATAAAVRAEGVRGAGVYDCGSGFALQPSKGNTGWDGRTCVANATPSQTDAR